MDQRNPTLMPVAARPGVDPAHSATTAGAALHDTHASQAATHAAPDLAYSPKSLGPKYPPHTMNGPLFEPIDMAGLAAAIVITLGPLAAYSLGLGA